MILLDCRLHKTKIKLLSSLKKTIEGMYSNTYDALIDALLYYKENLTIKIKNANEYEDEQVLREVLAYVAKENKYIQILISPQKKEQ